MTQTLSMALDFHTRTGNSETLKEHSNNQNPSWNPIVGGLQYLLDMFVVVNVPQNTRYLEPAEQRVMKKALYKSARLLHKA
jgi:uncharacterized membrane protein